MKKQLAFLVLAVGGIGLVAYLRRSAPEPSPQTNTPAPAASIVGRWQLTDSDEIKGVEFAADGTARVVGERSLATTRYRLSSDGGSLEMGDDLAAKDRTTTRVSIRKDELVVLGPSQMTYRRVQEFAPAINHPNRRPNDQQKQWLIGRWRSDDDDTGRPVGVLEFRTDGTFMSLHQHALFDLEAVGGTYRFHPEADNFIEYRFPDTGRTRAVYTEVSADRLVQWDAEKSWKGRHFRRDGDPEPANSLFGEGALTAPRLYRDYRADAAAADRQYLGKEVELTGFPHLHFESWGKFGSDVVLTLFTGEEDLVLCRFTPLALKPLAVLVTRTAGLLGSPCAQAPLLATLALNRGGPTQADKRTTDFVRHMVQPRCRITLKGRCTGLGKHEDWGLYGRTPGPPVVVLEDCTLVDFAVVKPFGKGD